MNFFYTKFQLYNLHWSPPSKWSCGNFRKWWQLYLDQVAGAGYRPEFRQCACAKENCLGISYIFMYHISPTWIFPLLHFDFGVTSHFVTIPRNAAQINWCFSSLVWCYQWSCRTPLYNAMAWNHSHRPRWIPWCCLPNSNGCWSGDVLHTSYDHPNSPWSAKPSDPYFAHGFRYCLGDKSWDQWSLMVIVCQSLTHFSWAVPPEHTTFIRNCVSFLDTGGAPIWNLSDQGSSKGVAGGDPSRWSGVRLPNGFLLHRELWRWHSTHINDLPEWRTWACFFIWNSMEDTKLNSNLVI